jgi:SAM-dependent methyltransferase
VTGSQPGHELAAYFDADAWTNGPQLVYDRLAIAALGVLPQNLHDTSAIDVGAGTGAATRELRRRGATVVACDTSRVMLDELIRQTEGQVPTFLADIRDIGGPDSAYDVAVAAFVINHLDRPGDGVAELARVTRPDGRVIATTFGADDHPIKTALDVVLVRHGFVHPPWYLAVKNDRMPRIARPEPLAEVGRTGGLIDVDVVEIDVDLSDVPVEAAVGYRLGLAHIAPFIAGLDTGERDAITAEAVAVTRELPPLRFPVLVLTGRPQPEVALSRD